MRYAALLLLLAALFVGACSSDDDDDGGADEATATATADDASDGQTDDDEDVSEDEDMDDESSDDGDSDGGEISGEEEEYAADLCIALDTFTQNIPTLINPTALASGDYSDLTDAFRTLAEDLEQANPPDFMEEYHEQLVAYLFAQADAFESGDSSVLEQLEDFGDLPEPSEAEIEAFARSAQNVEACSRVGLATPGG
jgi:hypothetical protein